MASNTPEPRRSRRPIGVWLILVFRICVAFVHYYVVKHYAGVLPLNPAQKFYHDHLTPFDHFTFSLALPLYWTATILLFMLRELAVPLSAIAMVVDLAVMIRITLTSNWLEALGAGRITVALGLTIELAILLYAIRLERKGVLS